MKLRSLFFLLTALLISPNTFGRSLLPATFQSWFQTYYAWESAGQVSPGPSQVIISTLNKFHYVFIAGFMNEQKPHYFEENIEVLQEWGVPPNLITVVRGSSQNSIEENSQQLNFILREISAQGPEPFVLIAHSKGGAEAMAFCLQNSDWTIQHVHAIFLVQAALWGSRIADFLEGEGAPVDSQMPLAPRVSFKAIAAGERIFSNRIGPGIEYLTRDAAFELWTRLRGMPGKNLEELNKKVFFILAHDDPDDMRKIFSPLGWYIQTYYDVSDGLMIPSDQKFKFIGTELIHLLADHFDLMVTDSIFRNSTPDRRAITETIVRGVAELAAP